MCNQIDDLTSKYKLTYNSREHKLFLAGFLAIYPNMDISRIAFFYLMGLTAETRGHIMELYDFVKETISPENMNAPWQTLSTWDVCFMAYNLYNGYYEPEDAEWYMPYNIFSNPFAPYFLCAVRMVYDIYFKKWP